MKYRIFPPEEMIEEGIVTLPLSKSIATRTLVLDAFGGRYHSADAWTGVCDDTRLIANALQQWREAAEGSVPELNLGASGAALRFLTAFFASQPGAEVRLTGCERLCQRPMQPLVDALRQCGATIECLDKEGFAPLLVKGSELFGGEVTMDSTISSQFISAILMAAPYMKSGLTLRLEGEPVSLPYILLTLYMMEQRGVTADREPLKISIEHGSYTPFDQPEEGDWSAAAFWYEVSALSAGWITLTNITEESRQGDRRAAGYFECLGVTTSTEEVESGVQLCPSPEVYGRLDLDLSENPDLAPALAVTCCLIGVPFKFTGLSTLADKECDRLQAIRAEMLKLGRIVECVRGNALEWDGSSRPVTELAPFSAHGDHRIAMALAPIAVYLPGIVIDGVECVNKSYPGYWDDLRSVGFTVAEPEAPGEAAEEEAEA